MDKDRLHQVSRSLGFEEEKAGREFAFILKILSEFEEHFENKKIKNIIVNLIKDVNRELRLVKKEDIIILKTTKAKGHVLLALLSPSFVKEKRIYIKDYGEANKLLNLLEIFKNKLSNYKKIKDIEHLETFVRKLLLVLRNHINNEKVLLKDLLVEEKEIKQGLQFALENLNSNKIINFLKKMGYKPYEIGYNMTGSSQKPTKIQIKTLGGKILATRDINKSIADAYVNLGSILETYGIRLMGLMGALVKHRTRFKGLKYIK